jgi:hypothetical protein
VKICIINRHVNGPAWGLNVRGSLGSGNNEVNPISDRKAIKKILNEAPDLSIQLKHWEFGGKKVKHPGGCL